jgi:hypothetical protein
VSRLLALISLSWWCGCVPLTQVMRPAPGPVSFTGTPTKARVIFARPANFFGSAVSPTLLDPQRQLVFGQAINDSYFAVDLEPGVYQVCPALIRFNALGNQDGSLTDHDWYDLGLRVPITELEVAAGNTYLLRIAISWGPRVRVLPIIPGSPEEERLLAALPGVRPAEVATDATEYRTAAEPTALEAFSELCRDSSGPPETWLRMLPGESRPTTSSAPLSP